MVAEPTTSSTRLLRNRVGIAAAFFVVWAVVIEARLVQLQLVDHAWWQAQAHHQRTGRMPVPARRGEILDRAGRVLADSVDEDAIFASPEEIKNPDATVAALCQAFGDCTAEERQTLTRRLSGDGKWAYVRRSDQLTPEQTSRVRALVVRDKKGQTKLPGIGFMAETRRYYPGGELAAHVLGHVGVGNKGLAGLESTYEKLLGGREGEALIEVDGAHRPFGLLRDASTEGGTLQLSIDLYLQHVAERELHAAVLEHHAVGGTALVMDPRTGEILALANEPTYDPNAWQQSSEDARRNRGVQDVYEPGSTFKVVTASAAIQEGVMTPSDMIDVSAGQIQIPGRSRPVSDTHRYGVLSFTDVLVKSSNVGAIKIGLQLGAERLGRYVRRFGFASHLSPDFRGAESAGKVWDPARWSQSALASVSMGYQVSVTPLQMAAAVSAVANGGELVQPRVVKSVITKGVRSDVQPYVVRRVITQDTAAQLTTIMEGVVERGTATAAQIPGYTIAGKTGTAAKLEGGQYSKKDYHSSFVGFIPSRQPALTILVMIDAPHGKGFYGGTVAAPVFKRIAEDALRYLGIAPSVGAPPPLLVERRAAAPASNDAVVVRTIASGGTAIGQVPDVIGLSARDALRVLSHVGLTPRMTGDGIVVQQDPRPGTPLARGMACALTLGRVVNVAPAAGIEQHR